VVTRTSATQITITADEVVLKTSAAVAAAVSGVSETVSISASGVGGLDTGSPAAQTWYYIYLIYHPSTLDVAGCFSTSAMAPQGTAISGAGYTYYAKVGVAYCQSPSVFLNFKQLGNRVHATAEAFAFTPGLNWAALDITGSALVRGVPVMARGITGYLSQLTGGNYQVGLFPGASSPPTGMGGVTIGAGNQTALIVGATAYVITPVRLVLWDTLGLYHIGNPAGGSFSLTVTGWEY